MAGISQSKVATISGVVLGIGGILALVLSPGTLVIAKAIVAGVGTILAALGQGLNANPSA